MSKTVTRKAQRFSKDDYFSADLPEKVELWDGVIGPYSDEAMRALLANWGADKVIKVTGPDVWREALAAFDAKANKD